MSGGGNRSGVIKSGDSVTTVLGITLDTPLRYSGKQTLSKEAANAVYNFENKRLANQVEFGISIKSNGTVLQEVKGGKHGLRNNGMLEDMSEVFSHNHPANVNEKWRLGGTFSTTDIDSFVTSKCPNYRALAAEGTYFISKASNFNATGLKQYYSNANRQARSEYQKVNLEMHEKYRRGEITASEANEGIKKAFNNYLVESHNALLKGQKTYGYTYGLERR